MSGHCRTQFVTGITRIFLATLLLSGLTFLPRPYPILAALSLSDQGNLGMSAVRDGALTRGGQDVLAPMAATSTGYRRLPALGNGGLGTQALLTFSAPGTCHRSVQAVDSAWQGRIWASEGSFVMDMAPEEVSVAGAVEGEAVVTHTFTATVTPLLTALPITYTWEATEQSTVVHGGITALTDTVGFSWNTGGSKAITVTANNALGQAVGTHNIAIDPPPTFTDMGSLGLPPVNRGALAWGDYDNDGDLDLLCSGDTGSGRITRVYRNNGNGTFSDIGAGLLELWDSAMAWGDYDRDGDLDIVLIGSKGAGNGDTARRIYRNNGNGTFSSADASMPYMCLGAVAWGDYDNDGDLDQLLAGAQLTNGSYPATALLRNNGNGTFTSVSHSLPALSRCDLAWGDYDNDDDLDLLISGASGSGYLTRVYRNNGNGTFTDLNAGLTGVADSSVAWGDYDNDGDLDVLIQGIDSSSQKVTRLYRNNSNSTFTDVGAELVGGSAGEVLWGDYDNDGDLDLLVLSLDGCRIYRNDAGSFVDIGFSLPGVEKAAAWGDYDNDGDLDFVLSGSNGSTRYLRFYRNNAEAANSVPSAPGSLSASVQGGTVTLSWNAASDAETPAEGMSYNLRVGTSSGSQDVLAPMANTTTGYRRLPALGNGGQGTAALLTFSTPGTYYWSVQAVDSAWQGGSWANESSFTVGIAPEGVSIAGVAVGPILVPHAFTATVTPVLTGRPLTYTWEATGQSPVVHGGVSGLTDSVAFTWAITGTQAVTVTVSNVMGQVAGTHNIVTVPPPPFTNVGTLGLPPIDRGILAWGDYDNDGDLDLLCSGDTGSSFVTRIYRNNGNSTFTDISAGLEALADSAAAWGDYDGDGDLDIAMIGSKNLTATSQHLYRNNGNGTFTHIQSGMINMALGAVTWGDYDNDGDLDLLQVGATQAGGSQRTVRLWRNDGSDTFTSVSNPFPALARCDVAWGDYDNDNDLDLLISGSNGPLARIYRNNGSGSFTDLNAGLAAIGSSSVAWGDYDNDGDLDVLIQGIDASNQRLTRLYRNNGNSTFTDLGAGLVGGSTGAARWGDYDNDGDLDLLVLSINGSRVYRNDAGSFVDIGLLLPGVEYATAAWSDYDNDGDLDFVLSGSNGSTRYLRFYRNDSETANSAPSAPSSLQASVQDGSLVTLSWQAASDAETPAAGLTYNLRVGTSPEAQNTVPPMANAATGYRRLPALGNANHGTGAQLTLPLGTYYWSVQAVDTSLAGGAFASEGSFVVAHAPGQVSLASPAVGLVGVAQTFTATVTPANTTPPLDYTWKGSGLDQVVHQGVPGLTDSAALTWVSSGPQAITVTVSNPAGTVTATRAITLYNPAQADFDAAPATGIAPLAVTFTNTTTGDYASSLWSFGDGITSTLSSPTHTYAIGGVYTVTLEVSNPAGSDLEAKPALITVYEPVQASFVATPTVGVVPLEVTFTNTSMGDYTESLWQFGDGITSTLPSPTHTYAAVGVYTITLTVSGPGGEATEVQPACIGVYEPVQAGFVATPTVGIAPLEVSFTNTSSGAYTSSLWDFGDTITSTLPSPTHTYGAKGVYTVTLEVANPGNSDTETIIDCVTVYVPVQAAFTAAPIYGLAPVTMTFTNTSSGDWSSVLWDFGDTITSTLASPTHTYTLPGVYTVTLTVSGPGGEDAEVWARGVAVYEELPEPGPLQSDLWLMNIGQAPAAANVLYSPSEEGGAVRRLDLGRRIPVHATHVLSGAQLVPEMPGPWLGSGSILATQPLQVAEWLQWKHEANASTAAIYLQAAPSAAGYFPLLAAREGRADRLVIHNPQSQAVAVTLRCYDRLGNLVLLVEESIPAGVVHTFSLAELHPDFSASAGYGSVYLTAGAPVSALALLFWGNAAEAYAPSTAGDTTLWLPGVYRRQVNGEEWERSEVAVRNPGGGAADVEVEFLALDGAVTHTLTDTIPANGVAAYNTRERGTLDETRFQALTAALEDNWEGTVRVTCSNGRALSGLSVSWLPGAAVTDTLSTPAIRDAATGDQPLAFPLVHRQLTGGADERYSRLLVQNTAEVSGTVTVEFYDVEGERIGEAHQVAIPALGSVRLDLKDGLELPPAALQALGNDFAGAAVLTPSQGVELAAVCQDLVSGEGRAAGYAGARLP